MNKAIVCVGMWLSGAMASHALINPNFTPRDLVDQTDLIVAAKLKATGNPLDWAIATDEAIKGKAPGQATLSLAQCNKDYLEDISKTLKACSDEGAPALLFAGTLNEEKRAYLHVGGQWLDARLAAEGRSAVAGYAPSLSGTYAGGTDMLARMADYLAREPDAVVPGLRLRLPRGMTGPVTVACWGAPKSPMCLGSASVVGHSPGTHLALRRAGELTVRFRFLAAGERSLTVTVGEGPKDVILSTEATR